jgi:hypothetical protein
MGAGAADDSLDLGFTDDEAATIVERSDEPLPAGVYEMHVLDVEAVTTKAGDMRQMKITLEIPRDGRPYAGRRVWERHTFATSSDDEKKQGLMRSGRDHLMDLLLACGLSHRDPINLCVGNVVSVKIKVRPASGNFGASNGVVAYPDGHSARKKMAGLPAPSKPSASKPSTPTAKPSSTKPAFMQRKQ